MAKKTNLGGLAYVIGLGGALILGLLQGLDVWTAGTIISTILLVAGLLIGFLNITRKEVVSFLLATIVLGAGAGVLSALPLFGAVLDSMLNAITSVSIPASIVVAVKTVMRKAR